MNNYKVAEALSRARARAGLSQRAAAEAAGLHQSQLSGYETGRTTVPAWVLLALLEQYRQPLADFASELQVESQEAM